MAEYLKDNALDFLREAEDDLKNGKYNLAIFHLEQALQLALKYKLFQLTGSFQKTHDIVALLDQVIELTNNENLRNTRINEAVALSLLRQAYIASRYLPYKYDEATVRKVYLLVKVILSELGIA
ncbi:HEPN domain-containing protein [Caldivirga sp.]|uniref:HEPN domain-containing protein n=1 Tax=Caldivirga sp. TaxID=2080243 RepID=UPI0025BA75E5|nr:HEPN domain-containing protein [Caldivirga sp.]